MTSRIVLAAMLCTMSSSLRSQGTVSHQRTTPPDEARYEILLSELAARYTFRLDRFTGETSQLVLQADSTLAWQSIRKDPHVLADTRASARPNYQMFSSGLAARYTFLINVNSGATWQLQQNANDELFWAPLDSKPSAKRP